MTIDKKCLQLATTIILATLTVSVHAQENLEQAAAKLSIIELCNRYAHAMDHGNPDAWIATWAPEGKGKTPWDGVQTLKEMDAKARRDWSKPQPHRHLLANHVITIDGDTAIHRCYAYLVDITDGEAKPRFVVEYNDMLRIVDGKWKFTHRRITVQK